MSGLLTVPASDRRQLICRPQERPNGEVRECRGCRSNVGQGRSPVDPSYQRCKHSIDELKIKRRRNFGWCCIGKVRVRNPRNGSGIGGKISHWSTAPYTKLVKACPPRNRLALAHQFSASPHSPLRAWIYVLVQVGRPLSIRSHNLTLEPRYCCILPPMRLA